MNRIKPINISELTDIRLGRKVYVWGAAIVGMGVTRSLERIDCTPVAFIDKSPRFENTKILGYEVLHPNAILKNPDFKETSFLIVASGHYENEIADQCRTAGLLPEKDFISARLLSPLDPSIDISGTCNLHCISCPNGNMEDQLPSPGFMSATKYKGVLDKLLSEIPLLGNIQICCWGEPLINPEAAEIIDITVKQKLLCALSTNLNIKRDFSDIVAAKPDWFRVSVSGYGKPYERTHTGGRWKLLFENLKRLRNYKSLYHPEMYVEVDYHLYRHNRGEEFLQMRNLCEDLGFAFRPAWAYLYPLDNVKAYCEGKPLSKAAKKTLNLMELDIDEGLRRSRLQASLPCPEESCLPITWDLKVRSCGTYFLPVISENFLKKPLQKILQDRDNSGICNDCMKHGLHRYTAVYVEEPLPPEINESERDGSA